MERKSQNVVPWRLSVAPMMDWTDRHCRYLHRLMSRQVRLYTEMVTAPALVRGGARHLLRFHGAEHPVALQLGGSDPAELAEAARMAEDEGYDEINLNVGCPSDRVQSGTFGAVLMKTPGLVADCLAAMSAAALAATGDFITRLKQDVPIWKKEHFEGGAIWIGTPDDPQGEKARAAENDA